jgi:hypothetical protein
MNQLSREADMNPAESEQTNQKRGQRTRNDEQTGQGDGSARKRSRMSQPRLADNRAPWRVQMQAAGTVLLVLVVTAIVALFYLNVSAKTTALGRKIQFYTVRLDGPHSVSFEDPEGTIIPIEEIDMRIAGLRARLAELTSLKQMEQRAQELGYQDFKPEAIVYLEVPGYQPREAMRLAPDPAAEFASISLMPAYRPSLLDEVEQGWNSLMDLIFSAVIQNEETRP